MPTPVDSSATIQRFLAEVRAALVRQAALRALLYGLAAALLALTGACAWASAAGPVRGSAGFYIVVLTVVAIVAGAAYLGWARPRRQWAADRAVARWIGEREPAIFSDLLSTVELDSAKASRARFSGELTSALRDTVATRVGDLQSTAIVPRRMKRPGGVFAATLAVTILASFTIDVRTGLAHLAEPPPPQPFGGAQQSSSPLVRDLLIKLTHPAYTGKPATTLPSASGDFRVLPGTVVDLEAVIVVPAERAAIIFDDAALDPIKAEVQGDRLHAQFTVDTSTNYRFWVDGASSKAKVEARPRRIEVDPDQPPQIELHAPADELDVAELRRVELAYVAEDDYGLGKIELVWSQDGVDKRKELEAADTRRKSAQRKFLWDLTEVDLTPGTRVAYYVETWDNDTISGPKATRSKTYYLRVFSPREKHEELVAAQDRLLENIVRLLGTRLVLAAEDVAAHKAIVEQTRAIATQIGTLVSDLKGDALADKDLRAALLTIREHLDHSVAADQAELARLDKLSARKDISKLVATRLGALDRSSVAHLEDDVILLSDWLDRQRLENLLAVGDEIRSHQERLKELLAEYKRTGSEEVRAELMREIRKLRRRLAELRARHQSMPKDVVDQFVNAEASKLQASKDCLEEVAEHLAAGDTDAADKALERCMDEQLQSQLELEQALAGMRGQRFEDSQKSLDQVRSDLADLSRDQKELSDQASKLWDRYAEKVDEAMKEKQRETRKKVGKLLRDLRRRVDDISDEALSPFSKEEKDVVERRLEDLRRMLDRGDIAEALSQAKEAQAGLEAMEAEMSEYQERTRSRRRTREAVDAIERAGRTARKLASELAKATPSPEEIMSKGERQEMRRLSRKQRAVRRRADKLRSKLEELEGDLPGRSAEQVRRALDGAEPHMLRAEQGMAKRDPSGSRLESREASKALEEGQRQLRQAARNAAMRGQRLRDDPVRIPGADEYRAPEKFREDILDAMKSHQAPEGYRELVKRYYEELVR